MHAFVSAKIGELSVRLETDLALKWLNAAVNVSVLLQSGTRGERFPAFGACVTPRPNVIRTYVTLEIRRVRKNLSGVRLLAILGRLHSFGIS